MFIAISLDTGFLGCLVGYVREPLLVSPHYMFLEWIKSDENPKKALERNTSSRQWGCASLVNFKIVCYPTLTYALYNGNNS